MLCPVIYGRLRFESPCGWSAGSRMRFRPSSPALLPPPLLRRSRVSSPVRPDDPDPDGPRPSSRELRCGFPSRGSRGSRVSRLDRSPPPPSRLERSSPWRRLLSLSLPRFSRRSPRSSSWPGSRLWLGPLRLLRSSERLSCSRSRPDRSSRLPPSLRRLRDSDRSSCASPPVLECAPSVRVLGVAVCCGGGIGLSCPSLGPLARLAPRPRTVTGAGGPCAGALHSVGEGAFWFRTLLMVLSAFGLRCVRSLPKAGPVGGPPLPPGDGKDPWGILPPRGPLGAPDMSA